MLRVSSFHRLCKRRIIVYGQFEKKKKKKNPFGLSRNARYKQTSKMPYRVYARLINGLHCLYAYYNMRVPI